ncbi:MAG TPA: acyl-CoA thioesterase domain-containing protein [Acidimicrobiia bacterium]
MSNEPARSYAIAEDLGTVLDIERLDRDLFRGLHGTNAELRASLFGGQIAAQALMAAGRTIDPDRHPHSLHGYFLRPGRPDRAVLLAVDRDRDGHSFSSRHVAAVQEGEVIFSMLASFHVDEPGAEYDAVPDELTDLDEMVEGRNFLLDIRAPQPLIQDGVPTFPTALWLRSAHKLPDDRLTQAAALTYVSDLGSGFGQVHVEGLPIGGPSIDHAVWFHAPIRIDEWVQLRVWPIKAGGSRGVYQGAVRDRAGRLGATLAQEMLLRAKGDFVRRAPGMRPPPS